MKLFYSLLLLIIFSSCANGKNTIYIGCTPANNNVIRIFLGIPDTDSVDFIRWRIDIQETNYSLRCNYGIGKPNTNGFINGGKWIELKGQLQQHGHSYYFLHDNKTLGASELNSTLIHFIDESNNLLVGTGGWSYTLNREQSTGSSELNFFTAQQFVKDSMVFQGRTPCGNFAVHPVSDECIKMKWLIVFYTNAKTGKPATYLLNRNRFDAGKRGTWNIITGKDGRIVYQLTPDDKKTSTYLVKLDDNILAFTDAKGNLLVGNEDFSFTLSRK